MHQSLRALVTDLEIRATIALDSLDAVSDQRLHGELAELATTLRHVRAEAAALLEEDLEEPALAITHSATYRELNETLVPREAYQLPFMLRFGQCDAVATGRCRSLLKQAGWPWRLPLVVSLSTTYYWTFPALDVIATPANEERRLLGIPILGHELGHIATANDETALFGDFVTLLHSHVNQQAAAPRAGMSLDETQRFFRTLYLSWLGGWRVEFACDLFGCYLVGPAYGWDMLRVVCLLGADRLYSPTLGGTHPADDARRRAVGFMLRCTGHATVADELDERWQALATTLGQTASGQYALAYPDELLQGLAEQVAHGCRELGLLSFASSSDPTHVASIVNVAWERLHRDPAGYGAWERETLASSESAWQM